VSVTDSKDDDSAPTIEIVEKRRRPPEGSLPEIKIEYTPAGRATLEAIADELRPVPLPATLDENSAPLITVRESFASLDTISAILEEANSPLAAEPAANTGAKERAEAEDEDSLAITAVRKAQSAPVAAPLEIFELATFVLRGADTKRLATDALRRRFVEERLLKRLPVATMSDVERVELAPWTLPGTLVLRVWCKAPA
jgi:hypothetical protein